MKTKLYLVIPVICIILLQSCVIRGTMGLYSGYSRMSENDRAKVIFLDSDDMANSLKKKDGIYAVTGKLLRKHIDTKEKAMVYCWAYNCLSSDYCYPLSYVQSYCDSRGIALYVVAPYYNSERIWIEQKNISAPIVSINEKYFGTKFCPKHTRLFMSELFNGEKLTKEELYSGIYVFNSGRLVSCSQKLEGDVTPF